MENLHYLMHVKKGNEDKKKKYSIYKIFKSKLYMNKISLKYLMNFFYSSLKF